MAIVLGAVFPDKQQAFLDRAAEIAQSRVNAGVHNPSDIKEGEVLGKALAGFCATWASVFVFIQTDLFDPRIIFADGTSHHLQSNQRRYPSPSITVATDSPPLFGMLSAWHLKLPIRHHLSH